MNYLQRQKRKKVYIAAGIVAIAIMLFLIFKPAISGNAVADEEAKCTDMLSISETKLQSVQAELATCNQLKAAAISDMGKMQNPSQTACDTADLEQKIEDLTKQRASIMKNLKDAQDAAKECSGSENNDLNASFNELAQNSANNICCKMRVDNPNIKAYSLDGNRVNCLETGDLALSCP